MVHTMRSIQVMAAQERGPQCMKPDPLAWQIGRVAHHLQSKQCFDHAYSPAGAEGRQQDAGQHAAQRALCPGGGRALPEGRHLRARAREPRAAGAAQEPRRALAAVTQLGGLPVLPDLAAGRQVAQEPWWVARLQEACAMAAWCLLMAAWSLCPDVWACVLCPVEAQYVSTFQKDWCCSSPLAAVHNQCSVGEQEVVTCLNVS